MLEQLNKYRSPIVLGVLILFLLLFVFYLLGGQSTNKELSAHNAEISQLEKEANVLQSKIDELNSAATTVDSEQQELLVALPKGDDSEGLIVDLWKVTNVSEARLKDVNFILDETNPIQQMSGSAEVQFPAVKQIKMSAIVEGTYTGIRNWVDELQKLPRIVNVDSFNFQNSYDNQNSNNVGNILTANIAFSAFYELLPSGTK